MEGAVCLDHGSLCGGIVCPVVVLRLNWLTLIKGIGCHHKWPDLTWLIFLFTLATVGTGVPRKMLLRIIQVRKWVKYSGQEMRNHSLQPVRCARRRFLTDEERVLSHVVRVGVDVDLPKLLQLLSRFRGGVESLWGIRVDVSDSWSSSWTWWT